MDKRENEEIPDEITQAACTSAIPALVDFVCDRARGAGFEDEKVAEISLAIEEVVNNIVGYACCDTEGEIKVSCSVHDSGTLIITIQDTGAPFNMLLAAGPFTELQHEKGEGPMPSVKAIKKAIRNIEYRRASSRNILILTVPRLLKARP